MSGPRTRFLLPVCPPPPPPPAKVGNELGPTGPSQTPNKRGMDPLLLHPPGSCQRHGALVTQSSLWLACGTGVPLCPCGKEENGTPVTSPRDTRPPQPAEALAVTARGPRRTKSLWQGGETSRVTVPESGLARGPLLSLSSACLHFAFSVPHLSHPQGMGAPQSLQLAWQQPGVF